MAKVAAPRSNIKATRIAFDIMGVPKNLELRRKSKKEIELQRRLDAQNSYAAR